MSWKGWRNRIKLLIDIKQESGDALATKEAVAMALERFGQVRIVRIEEKPEQMEIR